MKKLLGLLGVGFFLAGCGSPGSAQAPLPVAKPVGPTQFDCYNSKCQAPNQYCLISKRVVDLQQDKFGIATAECVDMPTVCSGLAEGKPACDCLKLDATKRFSNVRNCAENTWKVCEFHHERDTQNSNTEATVSCIF